jgi:uncharacterized protein
MNAFQSVIPNRTLVDTSAYFAFYAANDAFHARAVSIASNARRRLYTTNLIVAETHALLLNRVGRAIAVRFLINSDRGGAVVVRIKHTDELRAREIIFSQTDKEYSLTDATSFAVMERLRIGTAFTFDRHFAQFGFAVLGPEAG